MNSIPEDRRQLAETQFQAMLNDLPEIAKYLEKGDVVWNWAVKHFAAPNLENTVLWNTAPPGDPRWLGYANKITTDQVFIQLARRYVQDPHQGEPRNFDSLWSTAVMELVNANNLPKLYQTQQNGINGKYAREEYVWEYARVEYENFIQQYRFYKDIWKPYCDKKDINTSSTDWGAWIPDTFEGYKKLWKDKNYYPWTIAGPDWDIVILPAHNNKNRYKTGTLNIHGEDLSKEQLAEGKKQLLAMLEARPVMNRCIKKDDELFGWLVHSLAKHEIKWSSGPASSFFADYRSDKNDLENMIRIDEKYAAGPEIGINKGFQQLWFDAIYLLLDNENYDAYSKLYRRAKAGELDRAGWLMQMGHLGYETRQKVAEFYFTVWEPFCIRNGIVPDHRLWYAWLPPTFPEYLKLYGNMDSIYGDTWGEYLSKGEKVE